jgi:hypothetical protein
MADQDWAWGPGGAHDGRMLRIPALLLLTGTACGVTAQTAHAAGHDRPAQTECRTSVKGSEGIAICFNPDPDIDHVRLHMECGRWWDPDVDGPAVAVGPAETVTLSDHCWKELQSVWVTLN